MITVKLLGAKFRQWGKNPARAPYRKKLDRSLAPDSPIKFEDLGIRPAQMLEKKNKPPYFLPGNLIRSLIQPTL